MSKIPVKPVSRQTIWEFVKTLKRALAVENDLFFDIVYFLEYVMPIIFPDFVLEICPQEEMGNLHGETIPSEHKIRIREDVYIGACNGKGRDRLTVAHEIGHYFMHDEKSIVYCKLGTNEKLPNYRDSDWQADVFGGELLAPSYLIYNMSAEEIKNKCGVSAACANRQLNAVKSEEKKGFKII